MSKSSNNRRRILMVNRPMQKRLIMTMSIVPAICLAFTVILVGIFCYQLYAEAIKLDIYLHSLVPLFTAVLLFVVISVVFLACNALRISHQIAGPSYRICKSVERIRNGDIDFHVTLRQKDHLTEIRDELNLLLDTLNDNPPPGFNTRARRETRQELDEPVVDAIFIDETAEVATTHQGE